MSRHSDSKVQKTVQGAQAQNIGKILCGTGNEIDRRSIHNAQWKACFKFQEEGVESKDQSPGSHKKPRLGKLQQYQKHYANDAEVLRDRDSGSKPFNSNNKKLWKSEFGSL